MQSMLSSRKAARYPQLKHKLTILKGCYCSLQHNWTHLKECVVAISPDQRCMSTSEKEENEHITAVRTNKGDAKYVAGKLYNDLNKDKKEKKKKKKRT